MIKIKCMTDILGVAKKDQYHFAIYLNSIQIPFLLSPFLTSLEPTPYHKEIKDVRVRKLKVSRIKVEWGVIE